MRLARYHHELPFALRWLVALGAGRLVWAYERRRASNVSKKPRYEMRNVNVGRFEPREILPGLDAENGEWDVTGFGIPHHFVQLEIRTKHLLGWGRWQRVQIGARAEPSGENPW